MDPIELFLRHLHDQGFAEGTDAGYRSLLGRFHRYLLNYAVSSPAACTETDIRRFLKTEREKQSGPVFFNTVCRLKQFYRFLVDEKLVFYSR